MAFVISEAVSQEANIQPPRRGGVWAVTVDGTARAYDITALAFNGQNFQLTAPEGLYLTMQNDGTTAIYYYFEPGTNTDAAPATVASAGSAPAFVNAHCAVLRGNSDVQVRIRRDVDKSLVVLTSTGTSTLRLFASSESTPQAQ